MRAGSEASRRLRAVSSFPSIDDDVMKPNPRKETVMPNVMPNEQSTLDTSLLLSILTAVKKGDFSVRLPVDWTGLGGKIADALNDLIEMNEKIANEVIRITKVVGEEGKLTERIPMSFAAVPGMWGEQTRAFNAVINNLAQQTTEVGRVITAVAEGDLAKKMALDMDGRPLKGEFLRIGTRVNTMVDQLGAFASEVTRVAREVGTEGKLGGQAEVRGGAGTWKDLTDNVNAMAGNLTVQLRDASTTAFGSAKRMAWDMVGGPLQGEFLRIEAGVNKMVDQLSAFASEVTRVAREVGTEGRLGGQADVKGVAGTWKDLTDSVNFMAGNLTGQVRNIADVTKAVANGDLSKKDRESVE